MPRRDGTGPTGNGAMTGRGMGKCLSGVNAGNRPMETGCRGGRRGCGMGRGFRRRFTGVSRLPLKTEHE